MADEMCRVYGVDSVEAVVPVFNTNTLDAAAAKYWQLAGQFEGESCEGLCVQPCWQPWSTDCTGASSSRRHWQTDVAMHPTAAGGAAVG